MLAARSAPAHQRGAERSQPLAGTAVARLRGLATARPPASIKNTSNVSPPHSVGLPIEAGAAARRRRRFELRDGLRPWTTLPRVAKCGRVRIATDVEIRSRQGGGSHYSGLLSCGNVWTCPVCAAKVAARRAEEVSGALSRHLDAGGGAEFQTLTLPHNAGDDLEPMRRLVGNGMRAVKSGRPWQKLAARLGIVGSIRATEATHGANGWHPHAHVLLLTARPLTPEEREELRAFTFARWRRVVAREGYGEPLPGLCPIVPVRDADVGAYATKMGAALELTQGHVGKRARGAGRTPFAILADFLTHGDADDLELWREWEKGMKGARQLSWSHGLKAALGVGERTDEEVAAEEVEGVSIVLIPGDVWDMVARRPGAAAQLLEMAEAGGAAAVWDWLRAFPIRPPPERHQTTDGTG